MISIGSRVQVGSRFNDTLSWATVVDIIPANEYREAMYRVRFDPIMIDIVTITPNPNEGWYDADRVYGPFHF